MRARVRGEEIKLIPIPNLTENPIEVTPAIVCSSWSGKGRVIVPAKSTVEYELVYRPMTMTRKTEKYVVSGLGWFIKVF